MNATKRHMHLIVIVVAFCAIIVSSFAAFMPQTANAASWVTFMVDDKTGARQTSEYMIHDGLNADGSKTVSVRTSIYCKKWSVRWGTDKQLYVDGKHVYTIYSDRNAVAYPGQTITQSGTFNIYGGGTHHVTAKEVPFGEVTLQAGWKFDVALPWIVTFKSGYGNNDVLARREVYAGGSAAAPAAPTREGYDFVGWDKGFNNVQGDMTITAQWKKKVYTVDFKSGYGNNDTVKTQRVEHGSGATAPFVSRKGYTFTGWDKAFNNVTSNLTVTAQWKINTYTVTFKSGYGNNDVLKTEKVNYGSNATPPSVPKRTGYTHTGWTNSFTAIEGDVTTQATWKTHTYKIRFNANGRGTNGQMSDLSCTYDASANLPANVFERHEDMGNNRILHYTFEGWATSPGGSVVYADRARVLNLTATDGGVVNLYAVWAPINGWHHTNKQPIEPTWR